MAADSLNPCVRVRQRCRVLACIAPSFPADKSGESRSRRGWRQFRKRPYHDPHRRRRRRGRASPARGSTRCKERPILGCSFPSMCLAWPFTELRVRSDFGASLQRRAERWREMDGVAQPARVEREHEPRTPCAAQAKATSQTRSRWPAPASSQFFARRILATGPNTSSRLKELPIPCRATTDCWRPRVARSERHFLAIPAHSRSARRTA
jgi:hypothetical protein